MNTFGHHPDYSTDFCVEVDDLQGYAYEVRHGINFLPNHRSQWPFWGRLSRALMFARENIEHLDGIALKAKELLLSLEGYARGF